MDGAERGIIISDANNHALSNIPMEQIERFVDLYTSAKKERKFTLDIERADRIKNTLFGIYDFIKVRSVGARGTIYYRKKPNDKIGETSYRKLSQMDVDNMVRDMYLKLYDKTPANKIKETVETVKIGVINEMENLNDSVVQISEDLFWDMEDAELIEIPDPACMRMLFDGERSVKIDEIIDPVVKGTYRRVLENLNEYDGNVIPYEIGGGDEDVHLSKDSFSFAPFWTWANEDIETFNDLLKSVACCFMADKPKGAFVLIGLTRNGKSTFIKMLHMLFGWNNTSAVKLADLQNHHKNMTLMTTMLNAPDEEDEGKGAELLQAQSYFKSIASHEPILLDVLYSQEPQRVETNFMSFYPMNHFPEWKGSGATACMKRTLPLFFNNDLSKYDRGGRDFAKETFNGLFFSHLLGVVLAIAHYYHNKPMQFSDKMRENQEAVAEEVDNTSLYLDRFMSWFNGYSKKGLVYTDYQMWCNERDLRWQERKVFMHALSMRNPKETSYTTFEGERLTMYRLGEREGKDFFYEDRKINELYGKTVEEVILGEENKNNGRSVIALLDYHKDAEENKMGGKNGE